MLEFQAQGGRDGSEALKSKLVQPATNQFSHSPLDAGSCGHNALLYSEGSCKISKRICAKHLRDPPGTQNPSGHTGPVLSQSLSFIMAPESLFFKLYNLSLESTVLHFSCPSTAGSYNSLPSVWLSFKFHV